MALGASLHIDIAEVQTAEGKLCLFVGIDRTSKFAATRLVEKADRKTAWEFPEHLLKAVPCRIHTILTERAVAGAIGSSPTASGIPFAVQRRNRNTAYSRQGRFDMICEGQPWSATGPRAVAGGIEHRLTSPTTHGVPRIRKQSGGLFSRRDGQVERMNRTIKDGGGVKRLIQWINRSRNVKRFHYGSHHQLHTHLADFMAAHNFARRLKTLNGLTPYEYICKAWTS